MKAFNVTLLLAVLLGLATISQAGPACDRVPNHLKCSSASVSCSLCASGFALSCIGCLATIGLAPECRDCILELMGQGRGGGDDDRPIRPIDAPRFIPPEITDLVAVGVRSANKGQLDYTGFKRLVVKASDGIVDVPESEIRSVFSTFDANKDKIITQDEVKRKM